MDHSAYIRTVQGSDTAVLLIHGIMGTPRHFDMLLPLIPEEWSVYNVLLPGHGGTALDFGRSSMAEWKGHVIPLFEELCGRYEKIVLVGHSMGTLFALRMALERPDKVPFLFLLASPLSIFMKPVMVVYSARLVFGKIREDHPRECALRSSAGIETTLCLWEYLPSIPRFLELFGEVWAVRGLIPGLDVPCHVFQSGKDELVSRRARKYLGRNENVQMQILPQSGHYYYAPEDKARLLTAFSALCKEEKTR